MVDCVANVSLTVESDSLDASICVTTTNGWNLLIYEGFADCSKYTISVEGRYGVQDWVKGVALMCDLNWGFLWNKDDPYSYTSEDFTLEQLFTAIRQISSLESE